MGKTTLAVEYAQEYRDYYDHLFFTRADSTTSLYGGYRGIAEKLKLREAESSDDAVIQEAVKHYLETAQPARDGVAPYLLILDNADFGATFQEKDLRPFLPNEPRGHVLLTTRAQYLSRTLGVRPDQILRLDVFEDTEAIRFLADGVHGKGVTLEGDEAEAAAALAKELGYLPLALEQAAAYIAAQPGGTYRNYLSLYLKRSIEILERQPPEAGDYKKTVATTWQISFDEVERECPAAADLMRLCAFVAPDAIPVEFVLAAAASGEIDSIKTFFGDLDDAEVNEDNYNSLLAPLSRYSLAMTGNAPYTFGTHRLVQAVTRWHMEPTERRQWIMLAVKALRMAFPVPDFTAWAQCERLTAHVQALAGWVKGDGDRDENDALVFYQTGFYLYQRGRSAEAEPLFIEALKIRRQALPQGHPDIANSLNNLAELYRSWSAPRKLYHRLH